MSSKVLIIDSDIDFGEQVHGALGRLGLQAETVADGGEGAQLVMMEQPDLVVLGLLDTKGAGYGLCSKLKRKAPEIPVVMVIDAGEQGLDRLDRHRSMKARSADAYVTRPFTLQRFADVLNGLLPVMVDVPDGASDVVIGESARTDDDSLLSSGLFDPDEIAEIEAEADHAFESLVVGEPEVDAEESTAAPADQSYEDEGTVVAPLDLLMAADDEPTRVAGAPAMMAGMSPPPPPLPARRPTPAPGVEPEEIDDDFEFDVGAEDVEVEVALRAEPSSEAELEAELAAEVDAELEAAEPAFGLDFDDEQDADSVDERDAAPEAMVELPEEPEAEVLAMSDSDHAAANGLGDLDGFEAAEAEAREAAQQDRDNRKLRARVIELQQELKLAREELARREAEHAQHRQGDSAAKRELIEVREDLNRREREVLEMRDRLTAKDRQLVDLTDEVDRQKREKERVESELGALEAKANAGATAREEAEQEIESLRVRLSETRVRLEKAKDEADKTYGEIKAVQKKAADDLAELRQSHAGALAELRQEHADALADANGRIEEGRRTLAQTKADSEAAVEAARKERDQRIAGLERAHTEALDALRTQHRDEVEALRAEHGEALAAAKTAHDDDVARLESEKAAAKKAHEEADAQLRAEHKQSMEATVAEWQGKVDALEDRLATQTRRAEGAEAEGERLRGELEATTELLEQESQRFDAEKTRLEGELAAEKTGRADDVAERDARIADLVTTVETRDAKIGEHERAIEGLTADVADRDTAITQREKEIESLKAARDALGDRVATLTGELGSARAVCNKARTAMAVAQAFVERFTGVEDADDERAPGS